MMIMNNLKTIKLHSKIAEWEMLGNKYTNLQYLKEKCIFID